MTEHDAIFHVGVGKTATTTLQNAVFGRSPHIHCIGRPNHLTTDYVRVFQNLTAAEPHMVEWSFLEDFFQSAIETSRAEGKILVLSDETLMGSAPFQQLLAERLYRVCPTAKVVITIRAQPDIIVSYYQNHGRLMKGVPRSIEGLLVEFDDWLEFALERPQDTFLRLLNYDRQCTCYEVVFGSENVHAICYEPLITAKQDFAAQWARLLKIDAAEMLQLLSDKKENTGVTSRRVTYDGLRDTTFGKIVSHMVPFRRYLGPLKDRFVSRGPAAEIDLRPEQRHAIAEMFAPENARLAERHGLDLAVLGYPMPSPQSPGPS